MCVGERERERKRGISYINNERNEIIFYLSNLYKSITSIQEQKTEKVEK
jgi:hypothetical protein